MNTEELQKLALQTRSRKEAGITLLVASAILGGFLFVPTLMQQQAPAEVVIEEPPSPDAYANIPLDAKAAIVFDLATNTVLYEMNADAQLPLASLTKLLTVYAALAELPATTPITIGAEATKVEMPRTFNEGQTFSLADLARLTLTASLNDGAVAIATAAAKLENRPQSEMLAGAAAALELTQTYALNGSGLDVNTVVSGGYGSAHDLARLAGALAARAPAIALATTESSATATSLGGTAYSVKNTDPIVHTIPGLLLSKTGFTDLAGGNLALVFDAGLLHPIAIVVLGSSKEARFTDGAALVAATLAHFAGVASL